MLFIKTLNKIKMHISANYEAIDLTFTGGTGTNGDYTLYDLGDGITASTVHRIYCLLDASSTILINTLGGGSFTWTPNGNNSYLDIIPMRISISDASSTFIGFRFKNMDTPTQFKYK